MEGYPLSEVPQGSMGSMDVYKRQRSGLERKHGPPVGDIGRVAVLGFLFGGCAPVLSTMSDRVHETTTMVEGTRQNPLSVPEGVDVVEGSVVAAGELSLRTTEVLDVDDCTRGVAVLLSSRLSSCSCSGLRELLLSAKKAR